MNLQSDAMTSGKCRSSVGRKVFIGSLVAHGALLMALPYHAATAGSTPTGAASSAQTSGSSEGAASLSPPTRLPRPVMQHSPARHRPRRHTDSPFT